MNDDPLKTRVLILTDQYRIAGDIALMRGARLSDYLIEAKGFVAVTDADVSDLRGNTIMRSRFISVQRDHIRVVAPLADVTMAQGGGQSDG
jgi:hypothetical protein